MRFFFETKLTQKWNRKLSGLLSACAASGDIFDPLGTDGDGFWLAADEKTGSLAGCPDPVSDRGGFLGMHSSYRSWLPEKRRILRPFIRGLQSRKLSWRRRTLVHLPSRTENLGRSS